MKIETCVVGPIQTNCYIIEDNNEVIVIDPGDNLTRINAEIGGRPIREIIATHFHFDHVSALSGLMSVSGAPSAMSETDARLVDGVRIMKGHDIDCGFGAPHIDCLLHEGDTIEVGNSVFTIIETPGHSKGSICLYCQSEGVLFTGDTLFEGGRHGRTDFEYGSMEEMVQTLQTKFLGIPDDVVVYPGHERFSTMGRERKLNPYLR